MTPTQFQLQPGAVAFLKAASHFYKIVKVGEPEPSYRIETPERSETYWNNVIALQPWYDAEKEHLVTLLLNTRYNIKGYSLVAIGSLNESVAHPREIFRVAIASGAYAIVMMHNHPSGDPSPSSSDHALTRRIHEAGELLQVKVLDHVVIGKPETGRRSYFSFREAGIL